ncbi:MAG: glycosyltransferase [Verrucomicrobiota bacterium]
MTLVVILTLIYAVSLVVRSWLALSYAKSLPPLPKQPMQPETLTIAQAILSGDPLLESRLEANLRTFPDQHFIWLIDEEDAEARRIAERMQHPLLQVEFCPPCPDATNPKLWKLEMAAKQVKTPFFAVIDDDTTLPASSAAALVEAAKDCTVATGLPCYQDSGGLASGLLAQFVNNNSVFTYLGTSRLLPPFTLNGMGYVMRKEELDRIEYFKPILHELTDDLALAALVLKLGGSIHQSQAPLHVQTGVRDLHHYFQMMHRWYVFTLLLLKRQSIPTQCLIFLLHGLPPILLASTVILGVASGEFGVRFLAVLVTLFIMRLHQMFVLLLLPALVVLMAYLVTHDRSALLLLLILSMREVITRKVQKKFFGMPLIRPVVSLLSELIQPVHLVHSLAVRTIRWRTRLYKVRDTHDFSAV